MRFSLRPTGVVIIVVGVFILAAAGEILIERSPRPAPNGPDPYRHVRSVPDADAAQFVGSRACAGCHPQEFTDHSRSYHAKTLHPMRRDRLPKGLPVTARYVDAETQTQYLLEEVSDRFRLTAMGPRGVQSREIDFAMGAGKRAVTFVSLEGEKALRELRMSYLTQRHEGFVTPGQEGPDADPIGALHEGPIAQRCFACHSTVLPESRLVPEERFMGVGCEACHGPGKAHIAGAASGGTPGPIGHLSQWGARRQNELCGECHRSAREIDPDNPSQVAQTQRFQPYGLMKSACFLKSGDRLSCTTCHNPHRNVETTAASYEPVCRSCHGRSHEQTVCPVNARGGCVRCHMPQRSLVPGIAMADHWIRVFHESPAKAE
jgi:Cytochrome c554 and c-prime